GAKFMESPEGENIFQLVRDIVGLNDPYTVRQACLAMENMDLSPLVPTITRPLLMTNGTHDILCPPDLAASGLGAREMAEMNEHRVDAGRRARGPGKREPRFPLPDGGLRQDADPRHVRRGSSRPAALDPRRARARTRRGDLGARRDRLPTADGRGAAARRRTA